VEVTAAAPPTISVILPLRDAAQTRHLPATLQSIRRQEAGCCEVILVDGLGRHALEAEARAVLPEAKVLRPGPADPATARALGLGAARGELVAFLEPGDRWTGQALAALAKGFREAPGVDAVQGHARRLEPAGAGAGVPRRPNPPYPGAGLGALLVRRAALRAVDATAGWPPRGLRRLVIPDVVLEQRGALPPEAQAESPAAGAAPAMAAPTCSVVMVVRDGRRYLPAALASLRRQSLAPTEILAVVGASRDGTLAYLRDQPDLRVLPQVGSGLAQARNQGLAAARGEVIAFLDHDDLWQPGKLERQVAVLALFAGPAACITRFRTVHDIDAGDPARVAAPAGQPPRLGWTPSALLAHRELFRRVGAFDPATGMGCDTDWFFRLRLSGAPCGVAPEVLLDKRIHAGNLSRDTARNRAALFQVLRKNRAAAAGG
jgi:glycosyltransferase involved in cell wall biosynthesis